MITSELISYIKKQIDNNISKETIISKLIGAGWHKEDIDDAFLSIERESKKNDSLVDIDDGIDEDNKNKNLKEIVDKYREPIEGDNLFEIEKELPQKETINITPQKTTIPIVDIPKIETPMVGTSIGKDPVSVKTPEIATFETIKEEQSEVIKVETPISVSPEETTVNQLEVFNEELSPEKKEKEITSNTEPAVQPATVSQPIVESVVPPIATSPVVEPGVEASKIWTPMKIPVTENAPLKVAESIGNTFVTEKPQPQPSIPLENQNYQAPKETKPEQQPSLVKSFPKMPDLVKIKSVDKEGDLIPSLEQKPVVNPFGYVISEENKNLKKDIPATVTEDVTKNVPPVKDLSKIAMLSSYGSDMMSLNKKKEEIIKKKSGKIIKWVVFGLIIILLLGIAWAFASGRLDIKDFNITIVKKDAKTLLLNNSKILSSLKSYKTETNIEVTSPSFANISSGLINGETISGDDKDSISINTIGIINKDETGLLSDNFITIKSSLLQNYVTTDIKNDGSDLFVSVPNLDQILNENAPEPMVVKINEKQLNLIPSLFSPDIESVIQKINLYKVLSSGMPSYINKETMAVYDEFINNVEITEKGQENIKGIDTYHYSINTDRQLAKKLLTKISDDFAMNLSESDQEWLNQILGSVVIDSFEVWVGKGDNNIYQYSVSLGFPLSKVIGFEDKSIGNNQLKFSWKTTYYDFNVSNNISIPSSSTPAVDFVNKVKEIKNKNSVSSFKQLAANLKNAEGSYGKSSNLKGSCMNPTSGSLFSPVGHTKGSTAAVSSISMLLNDILKTTNGVGSCYSTSQAWSFAIPISDNYDLTSVPAPVYKYFYCLDNTGTTKELIAPPTGVVCK